MSDGSAPPRITCSGCGKTYVWKPELAGKRVKCKCGEAMTVPASMEAAAPPPQEEDLYDLAPSSEPPKPKSSPRVPLAPMAPRGGGSSGGSSSVGVATIAAPGIAGIPRPGSGSPLG